MVGCGAAVAPLASACNAGGWITLDTCARTGSFGFANQCAFGTSQYVNLQQTVSDLIVGAKYTISWWMKVGGSGGRSLTAGVNSTMFLSGSSVPAAFTRYSYNFTTTTTSFTFFLSGNGGTAACMINTI
jgi:hypothetical protein